jgi:hypothetical protein
VGRGTVVVPSSFETWERGMVVIPSSFEAREREKLFIPPSRAAVSLPPQDRGAVVLVPE